MGRGGTDLTDMHRSLSLHVMCQVGLSRHIDRSSVPFDVSVCICAWLDGWQACVLCVWSFVLGDWMGG